MLMCVGVISSRESFGSGLQLLFHVLPFFFVVVVAIVRLQGSSHLAFCSCGETRAL